ncbi:ParA family partition ATPase [Salinibacter ruber]|uniref:ParA family partition ATPase n=1 Tax=Salinibacter ruber TaxID=146919 RepID=UPI0020746EC2|nr:ParA family partition ATPase [Salinibacter ruber]
MPIVISSIHSKGGVGKSTVALSIADALHRDGSSVLVLDTDPQGTASEWTQAQDHRGPMVIGAPSAEKIEHELDQLGASYDAVVVDGSAQLKGATGSIIRISDLVLIPIQPSPADIWATENIVELIRERQEVVGEPAAGFVLNCVVAGTNIADDVSEILDQFELPVLGSFHRRVAFVEALVSGETPITYEPKGKAAKEIEDLYEASLSALEEHYATKT